MKLKKKLNFLSILTIYHLLLLFFFVSACKSPNTDYYKISGFAQGTTYHITYLDPIGRDLQKDIQSILSAFDKSLSIYDSNSIISRINKNETDVRIDDYFKDVFYKSLEVNKKTNGLFDVTIAPLVNCWGFGPTEKKELNFKIVDSLLQFVGMDKIKIEGDYIKKADKGVMLDFNAIAQGYSVDIVSEYLDRIDIKNYLVEIGGEIRTRGKNPKNEIWKVGVDKPIENNNIPGTSLQTIIKIDSLSMATSGNYRKFFEKEGKKYTHFIDPRTGYPVYSNLLSVTIITDDCMSADAYATAIMIMGLDKAKEFLTQNKNLHAYLIYSDEKGDFQTYSTHGIKEILINE